MQPNPHQTQWFLLLWEHHGISLYLNIIDFSRVAVELIDETNPILYRNILYMFNYITGVKAFKYNVMSAIQIILLCRFHHFQPSCFQLPSTTSSKGENSLKKHSQDQIVLGRMKQESFFLNFTCFQADSPETYLKFVYRIIL